MKRLISSAVVIAILIIMLVTIPVQAWIVSESFEIGGGLGDPVRVTGTVYAYESSYGGYKTILLSGRFYPWETSCVESVVVYISMWEDGHEDEAVMKVYFSPDLWEVQVPELRDTGITPICSSSRYLSVHLNSEENSDPDFGKVVLIAKGQSLFSCCYVAKIDFDGPEYIDFQEEETETLNEQDWMERILEMPQILQDLFL